MMLFLRSWIEDQSGRPLGIVGEHRLERQAAAGDYLIAFVQTGDDLHRIGATRAELNVAYGVGITRSSDESDVSTIDLENGGVRRDHHDMRGRCGNRGVGKH